MKKFALAILSAALLIVPTTAGAASTVVPGQQDRYDADQNGFPDAGQIVNGRYSEVDTFGDTVCKLVVTYRGDFGNDAYLNSGEISNHYECKGPDGNQTFNYQIVSQDDPRYRGNPDWTVFGGGWEYHVLTQGGQGNGPFGGNGNLVRPYSG
jgi:hypothetical protein